MQHPAPTDPSELDALLEAARQDFAKLQAQGLRLDITRGKPAADQLDLSAPLLTEPLLLTQARDGSDVRNYGGLAGLPELREIFADALQVPAAQLFAAGNSSLQVMSDFLTDALLRGVPGGSARWIDGPVGVLCPVPGYDRHFALAESLGMTLIPVATTDDGPDMDQVEALVAADASIKAIWCVPKYSNPTGITYSDEVVARLAAMPTAAPDFRILWDNAYAVHDITDEPDHLADVLALAAEAGNPDRPVVFGSTSKITFAGAGVGFFGASPANIAWYQAGLSKRTIGPDKVNQLRHAQFLRDAEGLQAHMAAHRALVRPKFEAVARILAEQLGDTGLARWTDPRGGYFVCLEVLDGTAAAIVATTAEAGVALTPAGATHPYGKDPDDAYIRIAPTFVDLPDLEAALLALTTCVKLVGYEALRTR
jgi:DNA-binding transcriptional MocR family regulator